MAERMDILVGCRRGFSLGSGALQLTWLLCLCCSTATYDGTRRASSEVAKLATADAQASPGFITEIRKIDNRPVEGSSFELLPGRHRIVVAGTHDPGAGKAGGMAVAGLVGLAIGAVADGFDATHSPAMEACFVASPGHTYQVRMLVEGGLWKIEVFDQGSTFTVQSPCKPK
jgi:hypothetical protein